MLITTIMVYLIALHQWQWRLHKILFLFIPLLFLDLIFVSVNIIKIWEGAWYTLVVTCIVSYTIKVWIQGSQFSNKQKLLLRETLEEYLAVHEKQYPQKIPGTAIFMSRSLNRVPSSLIIHLKHNKFLHEKLIFISVITEGIPKTQLENKFSYHTINSYTNSITARYGFMEIPNLHQLLNWAQEIGIIKEQNHVSFFLSKGIAVSSLKGVLTGFSEMLYIYLSRNSAAAYEFYHIPDQQIVELGVRYRV